MTTRQNSPANALGFLVTERKYYRFVLVSLLGFLLKGKCMTKRMKVCVRDNPAFAATALEQEQENTVI